MTTRFRQKDESLEQYEESLGLPAFEFAENEVKRFLTLPFSALKKLDYEQCAEGVFVLEQFGFHLQRAVNREQSRIRWATESIDKMISGRLHQQPGFKFEERKLQAIRGDDAAQKLDAIRMEHQLKLDRILYVSNRVESVAKALTGLRQAKYGSRQ